jgi:hypothetical protein
MNCGFAASAVETATDIIKPNASPPLNGSAREPLEQDIAPGPFATLLTKR